MKDSTYGKFYEKHAWVIFLVIGIMILTGGIPHMFGFNTDPALVESISGQSIDEIKQSTPSLFNLYNFYFSGGGLSDIGVGFFLIVISFFGYRKGQRWAWYTLWFVPVYFLAWIVLSMQLPKEAQPLLIPPLIVILVLSILGLLLPIKKFFKK